MELQAAKYKLQDLLLKQMILFLIMPNWLQIYKNPILNFLTPTHLNLLYKLEQLTQSG